MSNQPHDPYAEAPTVWPPYTADQSQEQPDERHRDAPQEAFGESPYGEPLYAEGYGETAYLHPVPQDTSGGVGYYGLEHGDDAAETAYLPPVGAEGQGGYLAPTGGLDVPGGPDVLSGGPDGPSGGPDVLAGGPDVLAGGPDVLAGGLNTAPYAEGSGYPAQGAAEGAYPAQSAAEGTYPTQSAAASAFPVQGDVAETAYLPPVTEQQPPPDAVGTAYLPPVDPGTPGPGVPAPGTPDPGAAWPDGWERGPGEEPGGQPQAPPPAARPNGPPDSAMSDPTLYGAPARRRPKPSAQELRAEGDDPVIPPGPQPAALTAGLALLLLITAAVDVRPGIAFAVAALQVVTAMGWFRLNGMWSARQGIAMALAGGLTATVAMVATGRDDATGAALGALGVWCVVIVGVQLRSPASSDERLSALTATVAATLLTVLAAGYLAAETDAVAVGTVAVAVATLARAVPLPPMTSPIVAVIAATIAGGVTGMLTDIGFAGVLLGFAAGGCALVGVRAASYDFPSRFVHLTAGVALPLTMAAPVVYAVGQAVG